MKKRKELIQQYETIINSTVDIILKRFEVHPEYGFIDTKFDLMTGNDHFSTEDKASLFRSGKVIYSWIQGRALESLAGHLAASYGEKERILPVLRSVCGKMQRAGEKNNGRMFFTLDTDGSRIYPDGSPCKEAIAGDANYSDLFVSKGLFNAAYVLGDKELFAGSVNYFKNTLIAIENHRFVTDQQPFDPANPVTAQEGKLLQGPFMIALSGITAAAELTEDEWYCDCGVRFIERILDIHMKFDQGRPDFFEAVHPDNSVWVENGKLLCDPGHTLEFLGLAQKFLLYLETLHRKQDEKLLDRCRELFPKLLEHTFNIGYSPSARGIIKSFDVISQTPINQDMPWWSLPETIRAAAENEIFCSCDQSRIIDLCSAAFWNDFTCKEQGYFAWQTRNKEGKPAAVIPASPDIDPGYHTNLSLIDTICLWNS